MGVFRSSLQMPVIEELADVQPGGKQSHTMAAASSRNAGLFGPLAVTVQRREYFSKPPYGLGGDAPRSKWASREREEWLGCLSPSKNLVSKRHTDST